ncbi:hypothetical protein AKJ16_DCAP09737 [Drosera capensis]
METFSAVIFWFSELNDSAFSYNTEQESKQENRDLHGNFNFVFASLQCLWISRDSSWKDLFTDSKCIH